MNGRFTPDNVIVLRNRLCHDKGIALSLHRPSLVSKTGILATSQNFASVPTDHPGLVPALPRLHSPHPHFRSRFLLLNVSSHQRPKLYVLCLTISLSQSAKRDRQGIDSSHPCKRPWRFWNGSHVLQCRGVRVEASLLFQDTRS